MNGRIMKVKNEHSVSVDSGQLMIVDPCYLLSRGDLSKEVYLSISEATIRQLYGDCVDGLAFAFATGSDGDFKVTTESDSYGVRRVVIEVRP